MVFKNFLSKAKDIDILSSIPDGILMIANNGSVEWTNDAALFMFGLNKNDVLKRNFNEIVEGGIDLVRQTIDSLKPVVGRIKTVSEGEIFAEITAKAVESYFVVSLRDVTQNYKTVSNIIAEQESSKKVNKDKNAFLVKLSNELKSPVHSIIGFSQAMIDGLGGEMSDKQEKYVKIINKNSNEVLYMMNKIVELAQTESHLVKYNFQIFDVLNTVQSVLKSFDQQIKSKNLILNVDLSEVIKKTIFSDEDSLKIILQNIIETSLNSTDIGSISVKVLHPDLEMVSHHKIPVGENATGTSFIMFVITDTGAGFSTGDMGVLFDPYAQLDRPNKKNIVKSIALASVKNLLKYLKGDIWVESEPMQGATYNVIVPIERMQG